MTLPVSGYIQSEAHRAVDRDQLLLARDASALEERGEGLLSLRRVELGQIFRLRRFARDASAVEERGEELLSSRSRLARATTTVGAGTGSGRAPSTMA